MGRCTDKLLDNLVDEWEKESGDEWEKESGTAWDLE